MCSSNEMTTFQSLSVYEFDTTFTQAFKCILTFFATISVNYYLDDDKLHF